MKHLSKMIERYKQMRSLRLLERTYRRQYALVGLGHHCVDNLLPVMQHLQLPLKYICCTSERKSALVSQKYKGVRGTVALRDILSDESVKGVFVAAAPHSHFDIAQQVIEAGKALFIEKPPCQNLRELNALIAAAQRPSARPVVVGLQRRFAPATRILQKRLSKERLHHYHYRYLTGLYPEGDALTDLFIHPLDYVGHLFGKGTIKGIRALCSESKAYTLLLTLEHRKVTGILELSTDYSWQKAQEHLSISTDCGIYVLERMERLDFIPRQSALFGIPLEKIWTASPSLVQLYGTNAFLPTLANHPTFSQGFFSEIVTFADIVEGRILPRQVWGLESLTDTYALMEEIRAHEGA